MLESRSTNEESLKSLLGRIASGDEKALKVFYWAFEARVFRYAESRLNDPFAAADILNEVMIDIWRGAGGYAGRSKVSTWVFGIVHHKVVDHLRRERRHANHEPEADMVDTKAIDIERAIDGARDAGRLRDCLRGLSDAHRQVIHLAFFEDMPYEEIAAVAGCPVGTVKTRVFHAKQALKRCLGASG